MNTTNPDSSAYSTAATPPGEHIPGPPSGGLTFIWIVWVLAAAVLFVFGGLIFFGILSAVS